MFAKFARVKIDVESFGKALSEERGRERVAAELHAAELSHEVCYCVFLLECKRLLLTSKKLSLGLRTKIQW